MASATTDKPATGKTSKDKRTPYLKAAEEIEEGVDRYAEAAGLNGKEVQAVPVEEIRVDGTTQLGLFDAGGKKATSASLRLSGGKILLLDGKAFRKHDVIHFEGTAVVREVALRDTPDPTTGSVVSCEQKHTAQILDLTVTKAG